MELGQAHPAAVRAHLRLAALEEPGPERPSLARRSTALSFAVAYLIAAPMLLAQDALAGERVVAEPGAAVLKGSAGPADDPEDEDNDDGREDGGTSARGEESVATTGGVQSTNQRGNNADGRETMFSSVAHQETKGTTFGEQSTRNRDGDNTNGRPDRGTSVNLADTRGTTGGMDSSWTYA